MCSTHNVPYAFFVFLVFVDIPEIEVTPKEVSVNASGDVTISCSLLRGSPQPDLAWDVARLISNVSVESFQSEDGYREELLHLSDVQVEDSGKVYCLATNEAGITKRPVIVIVYGEYNLSILFKFET